MPKYLLVLFSCLLFFSCKKRDRVCTCTVTVEGISTSHSITAGFPPILQGSDETTVKPIYTVNTAKTTYDRITEKDIRKTCFSHSEESYDQVTASNAPGLYTVTTRDTGTKSYDCVIE